MYCLISLPRAGSIAAYSWMLESLSIKYPEYKESVDILFKIYTIVYGTFDKIIHFLDPEAYKVKTFSNWFMTLLSIYGLGFQLLIIAIMLPMNLIEFIVPFFIIYTLFIFVIIGIRKTFFKV